MTSNSFALIADRPGKLIPMLSSDQGGEVIAAAAAIGRALKGAGLDWHDLARRAAAPTFADMMQVRVRPATKPSAAPEPPKPAEPPTPPKPKREPSPWPTWATLSRFQRLAWMDVIKADASLMTAREAEAFNRFYRAHYTLQEGWSRQDTNLFNRSVRTLWERGWRPDARAA